MCVRSDSYENKHLICSWCFKALSSVNAISINPSTQIHQ